MDAGLFLGLLAGGGLCNGPFSEVMTRGKSNKSVTISRNWYGGPNQAVTFWAVERYTR